MRSLQSLRREKASIVATMRIVALAAAALAGASCATEEVHGQVMVAGALSPDAPPPPGTGAWIIIAVSRDDCLPDGTECPWYRVRVDGKWLVHDAGAGNEYFSAGGSGMIGFIAPAGPHVFELVDSGGDVRVATPVVQTTDDTFHTLAVFGAPAALEQRWIVEDTAVVPTGMVRAYLVNALGNHDPIQPVRCAAGLQPPCAALAGPLVHGEAFEVDSPAGTEDTLGWQWVPGGAGAAVNGVVHRTSFAAFPLFGMPTHLLPPDSQCPSCIWSTF
jgi:hypothetical protein